MIYRREVRLDRRPIRYGWGATELSDERTKGLESCK
jgi:hypothetical protein